MKKKKLYILTILIIFNMFFINPLTKVLANESLEIKNIEFTNYEATYNKEKKEYTIEVNNNITSLSVCKSEETQKNTLCIKKIEYYGFRIQLPGLFYTQGCGEINENKAETFEKTEKLIDLKPGINIIKLKLEGAKCQEFITYKLNIKRKQNIKPNPKTGNIIIYIISSILISCIVIISLNIQNKTKEK